MNNIAYRCWNTIPVWVSTNMYSIKTSRRNQVCRFWSGCGGDSFNKQARVYACASCLIIVRVDSTLAEYTTRAQISTAGYLFATCMRKTRVQIFVFFLVLDSITNIILHHLNIMFILWSIIITYDQFIHILSSSDKNIFFGKYAHDAVV